MAPESRLLAVLAKFWTPGQVKTRLAAAIGDSAAAELHHQFVATTLARMATQGDVRWLAATPDEAVPQFEHLASAIPSRWTVVRQRHGDLGERMKGLFEEGFTAGMQQVVLIGADSPDLPTSLVTEAFQRLRDCPVAIGPSADGGYYLIGAARNVPPIFDGMSWSTSSLFEYTVRRLTEAGIGYSLLPPWRDVDDHADLVALYDRLTPTVTESNSPLQKLRQTIARWAMPPAVSAAGA